MKKIKLNLKQLQVQISKWKKNNHLKPLINNIKKASFKKMNIQEEWFNSGGIYSKPKLETKTAHERRLLFRVHCSVNTFIIVSQYKFQQFKLSTEPKTL